MPQWRLGLVGVGTIARYYLAGIARRDSLRLVAVCDIDPRRLDPFRDRVACYGDHRDMLADTTLDAVIVAPPNDLHVPVCRDVLDADVPVCVEKPLAVDVTAGRELVARARERGLPLLTAFHRRYNAAVVELLGDLATRAPVRSLRIRYLESIEDHVGDDRWYLDPDRCGGGCVADNGPNAFDLARLLLGEVRVTWADIRRDVRGIDRQAQVGLRAGIGATVRVELDWSYDGECKDLEVRLADGTTHRADMLRDHPDFKGSLWHEYTGVLADLEGVLKGGRRRDDGGLPALELVTSTYSLARAEHSPVHDGGS